MACVIRQLRGRFLSPWLRGVSGAPEGQLAVEGPGSARGWGF